MSLSAGTVSVPIPLRFFPPPPGLPAQRWEPSQPAATTLPEAAEWSFDFTWQHHDAAQDAAVIGVSYDGTLPQAAGSGGVSSTFFTALAQFATVWEPLQQALASLDPTDATFATAVNTFAALVAAVATSWTSTPPSAPPPLQPTGFPYLAETSYVEEGLLISRSQLVLTSYGAAAAPEPPLVYLPPATDPLPSLALPDGDTVVYTYPPGTPAFTPLLHRAVFAGNQPGDAPMGAAYACVLRNGAIGGPVATNPAFVYQTPVAAYSNAVLPYVQSSNAVVIGSGAPSTVAAALQQALETILPLSGGQAYWITTTVDYGLCVNAAAVPPLIAPIPALFAPQSPIAQSADIATYAGDIAAALASLTSNLGVGNAAPDVYVFAVVVSIAPAGETTPPGTPILQLSQLQFQLA
jgi:hypothetical protein